MEKRITVVGMKAARFQRSVALMAAARCAFNAAALAAKQVRLLSNPLAGPVKAVIV
jgi:hypothetical protein